MKIRMIKAAKAERSSSLPNDTVDASKIELLVIEALDELNNEFPAGQIKLINRPRRRGLASFDRGEELLKNTLDKKLGEGEVDAETLYQIMVLRSRYGLMSSSKLASFLHLSEEGLKSLSPRSLLSHMKNVISYNDARDTGLGNNQIQSMRRLADSVIATSTDPNLRRNRPLLPEDAAP